MVYSNNQDRLQQQAISSFWENVPQLWHRIRANVRNIAVKEFGITVEQFHLLRHIRKGMGSMSELANARGVSRPAVSQAVETLVNKGLILRGEKTGDRRFVHLELTLAGDSLLSAIFQKNRAWMETQFSTLSPDELTMVIEAFGLIGSLFKNSPEGP